MAHPREVALRLLAAFVVAASVWSAPRRASAEPPGLAFIVQDAAASGAATAAPQPAPPSDPFLPGAGHVSVSIASGIPFAAIGEVAVGASDWFAVSAIGGIADTLHVSAFGGSLRVAVARSRGFEVLLSLPVLYYPPTAAHNDEPWLLTNPSLVLAYKWGRASVDGGVGGIFTTCTDGLAQTFGAAPEPEGKPGPHPMVNGAWNTFHLGGSFAFGPRVSSFVQATVVMSGVEIAQSYGEKIGPPVVALAGVRVVL